MTQYKENFSSWIKWLGFSIGLIIFLASISVLHKELSSISFPQVMHQVRIMNGMQIALAFCFVGISYFALSNYDRLALNYLGLSFPFKKILPISFTAFAVGNSAGFSALTGGAIRYRAYTLLGLSALEIASVIAFCSTTFLIGGSTLFIISLLFEPIGTVESLGISHDLLIILCFFMVVMLAIYAAIVFFMQDSAFAKALKIPIPKINIFFQQLLFSSIDFLAAVAALYVLLPSDSVLTYPVLLCACLLAIFLGVLSSVPGGVGVFEGALLVLLPEVPRDELLGSLIVYRIVYYFIPLFIAVVIIAKHEYQQHLEKIEGVLEQSGNWVSGIVPQLLGLVVFLSGAILLFSGSLPADASRITFLKAVMPLAFLETSHMINSAVGVAMLIVARGLFQRIKAAFQLTLALLLVGVIVSLGKGLDFEESLVLIIAFAVLWVCRQEFYRPGAFIDLRFSRGWILSTSLVLFATLGIGLFVYQNIEYRDALWWRFAFDANAPRMLRGLLSALIVAAAFGLYQLTRAAPIAPQLASDEELEKAKCIIGNTKYASANIVLLGDKRLLFHPANDAFIMYQISGNSWVALGDPVGNSKHFEELVWQFREISHRHGGICSFYQVKKDNLTLYVDLGLSLSKLGEEGWVSLTDFTIEGSRHAELRQARNKGLRTGMSFEVIPASHFLNEADKLKTISDNWLQQKSAGEKSFSLGSFNTKYLSHFDYIVIKFEGEDVAFANLFCSKDRSEFTIDLMRYSEKAPKGVMDYLFVELLLWGKAEGYQRFSLGIAPLAGLENHPLATFWHKVGNQVFRFGDNFYNFEGLRNYKEKFHPEWEPIYLASPGGLILPKVLIDIVMLISGGLKKTFVK